jgi:uncharacterized protein
MRVGLGTPLKRTALFVGIALALLPVMLRWFEQKQVYHPSRRMEAFPAALGRPVQDVWFTTVDGVNLNGWFFPGNAASARQHRVLLLCHGNAGNISHRLLHVSLLLETGAAVFVFDYRGYGRSQGTPTEAGTYLDALAAHRWLVERGFTPESIVAIGESLGGAVAAELALRNRIGGLLLLSTFTSIPDLGSELFPWLPVRRLARIRYDTRSKLPRIHTPVIVVHSRADSLVPFHHAEGNFAAARDPKLLVEVEGDHNDLFGDLPKYRRVVERLLDLSPSAPGRKRSHSSP